MVQSSKNIINENTCEMFMNNVMEKKEHNLSFQIESNQNTKHEEKT
jgi:hypothetical protein